MRRAGKAKALTKIIYGLKQCVQICMSIRSRLLLGTPRQSLQLPQGEAPQNKASCSHALHRRGRGCTSSYGMFSRIKTLCSLQYNKDTELTYRSPGSKGSLPVHATSFGHDLGVMSAAWGTVYRQNFLNQSNIGGIKRQSTLLLPCSCC